ncbi:coiled-coil domain-containing protein 42 homolog [Osmerus eperlanus]|uniref:coiled-coil domain-containing protein 42 homolog n=1 Tax=Osmerus eperlanus TaxID=29151 RepID=UPI002E141449
MDIGSSLPFLDKDDSRLRLKVENRMKNIFVTQVDDAREEVDNVNHIPVITETSRILDTGVNTLQRTRLLKKQVEMDEMDRLLALKRHDFKCHMQALAQRRAKLEQKQQETRERANKFEKFVEDNEGKRRRALKKYQLAKQQNHLKEIEKEELAELLERLQARQQYLKDKVTKYKMYEDYLMKILDFLPENYLDYGSDSQVTPIIRRHETLSLTHQDLEKRVGQLVEELEEGHRHLEALKQEHNSNKLMANRTLSELQSQWDSIKEQNKQKEINLLIHHGQSRNKLEEVGCLVIAVRNLGEQCYLQNYGPLEEMDMLTILDMVKEFILERADMEKRVTQLMESGSAMTSATDRGSGTLKNNSRTQLKTQLKSASKMSGKSGMSS